MQIIIVHPRLSRARTVRLRPGWLLGAALLLVGLVISNSAARLSDQVKALRTREAHLDALNSLSRDLTRALSRDEMLKSVVTHVERGLNRPVVILLPGKEGLQPVAASPGLDLEKADLKVAIQAYERVEYSKHHPAADPEGTWFYLLLETTMGRVGVIGVGSTSAILGLSPDAHRLLEGFASLAALAIERAHLSEQANQAKILENTERLQAALLNSISHELRTPLVSITGALSTLADAQDDEGMSAMEQSAWREMVETAYEESQRLNLLVGNLLDMTRLEAGAFQLTLEPCDVQDLVGIVLSRFAQRRSDHKVQVSLPDELPLIKIDVALMAQALLNLLDNAAKYSPEHAPIDLQGNASYGEAILTVLDRGIGIPSAELPAAPAWMPEAILPESELPTPPPYIPAEPLTVETELPVQEPEYLPPEPLILDINAASLAQFEHLPGIGFVAAQNIITYREANGPFTSIDDLIQVDGIEPSLVEALRTQLTITKPEPELEAEPVVETEETIFISARQAVAEGEVSLAADLYNRLVLQRANLDQVITDMQDALYRYPLDINFWQIMGDAYLRTDKLQEALDAYSEAEELLR